MITILGGIALFALALLFGFTTGYLCLSEDNKIRFRNHSTMMKGYNVIGDAQLVALNTSMEKVGSYDMDIIRSIMTDEVNTYMASAKVYKETDRVWITQRLMNFVMSMYPVTP